MEEFENTILNFLNYFFGEKKRNDIENSDFYEKLKEEILIKYENSNYSFEGFCSDCEDHECELSCSICGDYLNKNNCFCEDCK